MGKRPRGERTGVDETGVKNTGRKKPKGKHVAPKCLVSHVGRKYVVLSGKKIVTNFSVMFCWSVEL